MKRVSNSFPFSVTLWYRRIFLPASFNIVGPEPWSTATGVILISHGIE